MGFTISLLFVAAGAIMTWAIHVQGNGFDINTIGIILMVVGVVGLIASTAFATRGVSVVHDNVVRDHIDHDNLI